MLKSSRSIMTLAFSFLIALSVALVPIRASAAETYGTVEYWDGPWQTEIFPSTALAELLSVTSFSVDDTSATVKTLRAHYESTGTAQITMSDLNVGNYLNGSFEVLVTTTSSSSSAGVSYGTTLVSAEPVIVDGMIVYIDEISKSWTNHSYTYRITVDFEGYKISEPVLDIPINLKTQTVMSFVNTSVIPLDVTMSHVVVSEYTGTIKEYSDLRDVPTIDGDFANYQNTLIETTDSGFKLIWETLINKFSDLSYWFSNLSSDIGLYIGDLIYEVRENTKSIVSSVTDGAKNIVAGITSNISSNFNSLFQRMDEDQDELINGYDSSAGEEANNAFETGAGELVEVEDILSNTSMTGIDNYVSSSFDTNVISSLGPSLLYVVTWFTNFWNMGGLFTQLLNIGLALFVAFFILRFRGNK